MRLHYISSSPLPSRQANSVHVMKMCSAFANEGYETTLYARKSSKSASHEGLYRDYGVHSNFQVKALPYFHGKIIWNISYCFGLWRIIKSRTSPDLFYGRYPLGLAVCSYLYPKVKTALESHALPLGKFQKQLEKYLLKRPNFTKLVVISEALQQDYLRLFPFLDPARVIVAHDGADVPEAMDAGNVKAPDLLGESPRIKIAYCGRLTHGKGMGLIAELVPLCPDVDFHIIGGSDDEVSYWRQKINADNVYFYGHINHGDLAGYYQQMDVMLAPLQKENKLNENYDIGRWTSPLKIFEYMSFKKPIVASDIPVLREVLRDGENSLLVSPVDAAEWRDAINKIVTDKDLSLALGDQAFYDLSHQYTWNIRAKNILSSITTAHAG